ncbi:MAG: SOS response-associated peptidase [Nitrospira sp.]|nr:SOS response-associated peptidase [Nitrospira sp.]MBS0194356.1 SOS response-associated peptidase [Pseudomonadota bacterium]
MCGRFVQLPPQSSERLPWPSLVPVLSDLTARYNLAPTQRAAVVLDDDGAMDVRKLRWGLLPHWMKDPKQSYATINARIETVDTKPAYRSAWKHRRCLIPMRGYYEWQATPTGKQPYYVALRDGGDLYAASLWEHRHALQLADELGSCTVITTNAEDEAGKVHDRMPVFIPAELVETYLHGTPVEAMTLLLSLPTPDLTTCPVSRRVNAPKDDDPDLLTAIPLEPKE